MLVTIRRALLSVSDKTGLVEFARALAARKVEILSTGGTARALVDAGIPVIEVSTYTGFPEIMDGRVKTLHPRVHGGLLGRRGTDDAVMAKHDIPRIDLLAVNLYPFAATVAKPDCTYADAIENIDIGGPAMVRAASKNHESVTVVVDPADYAHVLADLEANAGATSIDTRTSLAAKAFAHTAKYDTMVSSYLLNREAQSGESFPETLPLVYEKLQDLRYGENPHQRAAFYRELGAAGSCVATARMLQGKELSFNNIADTDTAVECVRVFNEPACVIVKHSNPCGVSAAVSLADAYERAYRTDPTSAFGGIIAFNRELDEATASAIVARQFVEVSRHRRCPRAPPRCSRPVKTSACWSWVRCRSRRAPNLNTAAWWAACWCRPATPRSPIRPRSRWSRRRSPPPRSTRTCGSPGACAST